MENKLEWQNRGRVVGQKSSLWSYIGALKYISGQVFLAKNQWSEGPELIICLVLGKNGKKPA